MLICMNQPSVDKFLGQLGENGVLLYDSSTIRQPPLKILSLLYAFA